MVNPAYRTLDGQVRKKVGILGRKVAEFGAVNLERAIEPRKVEAFEWRKTKLREHIAQLHEAVATLQAERKATQRHIPSKSCPKRNASSV